jgi:hypothetical protein
MGRNYSNNVCTYEYMNKQKKVLAESIAQTLNVTSCYVCGGTNMGDHWVWEKR